MRSRCMSLLPRTTLHSDSEQYCINLWWVYYCAPALQKIPISIPPIDFALYVMLSAP